MSQTKKMDENVTRIALLPVGIIIPLHTGVKFLNKMKILICPHAENCKENMFFKNVAANELIKVRFLNSQM